VNPTLTYGVSGSVAHTGLRKTLPALFALRKMAAVQNYGVVDQIEGMKKERFSCTPFLLPCDDCLRCHSDRYGLEL
jgi:hypothetical protein